MTKITQTEKILREMKTLALLFALLAGCTSTVESELPTGESLYKKRDKNETVTIYSNGLRDQYAHIFEYDGCTYIFVSNHLDGGNSLVHHAACKNPFHKQTKANL